MQASRISFGITFVSGIFQKDQRHSDSALIYPFVSTVMKSAKTEHIRASSRIVRQRLWTVSNHDSAL